MNILEAYNIIIPINLINKRIIKSYKHSMQIPVKINYFSDS